MKTLTIIGGTGFFGKSILDYAKKKGLKQWNISKIILISRKKKIILPKKDKKIKNIIVQNIFSNIIKIKKLPNSDFIIYAAKSKDLKKDIDCFDHFLNLIKNSSKSTKTLFTSSGAVYGEFFSKLKIHENRSININNIKNLDDYKKKYAIIKIKSEKMFKSLGKKGFKVSIARCFTFIGKHILNQKNFAISNFVNDALYKKNIYVNAKKETYRSYMYSDDLVEWLMKILLVSNKNCPTYNVGSDESVSIKDVASTIGKIFKKSIKYNQIKSNKIDYYVPSIKKPNKDLNLKIKYSFKKAILASIKDIKK